MFIGEIGLYADTVGAQAAWDDFIGYTQHSAPACTDSPGGQADGQHGGMTCMGRTFLCRRQTTMPTLATRSTWRCSEAVSEPRCAAGPVPVSGRAHSSREGGASPSTLG
jgi:hypothetical protein